MTDREELAAAQEESRRARVETEAVTAHVRQAGDSISRIVAPNGYVGRFRELIRSA